MIRTFGVVLFTAMVAAKDGAEFKGAKYISLSRQAKSDKIWSKVTSNSKMGGWRLLKSIFVGQNSVFDTEGDEFDCNFFGCREKTIHS